jgi:hypothetical protein
MAFSPYRKTAAGLMLPSKTKIEPTQKAKAYMKNIRDWEKANTKP